MQRETVGSKSGLARSAALAGIALLACLINAAKPIHIDDPAYLQFARQIAMDPLHPYSFTAHYFENPCPANEVLAPPVFLYWLGLSVKVSEQPLVWHLLLLPWLMLLTFALDGLARRIAGETSVWLTAAFVLSPAVLPGINLMLDLPALALSAAAWYLLLRALDDDSWTKAIAAGVILGLACETKYTAFSGMLLWVAAAFMLAPNPKQAVLPVVAACLSALVLVAGIEALIYLSSRESHLYFHTIKRLLHPTPSQAEGERLPLAFYLPYAAFVGIGCPAALLIFVSCVTRRLLDRSARTDPAWQAVFFRAGIVLLLIALGFAKGFSGLNLTTFTFFGFLMLVLFFAVIPTHTPVGSYLYLCLLIELVFCIWISPFPAMRRTLGIALVCWLAACLVSSTIRPMTVRLCCLLSILIGGPIWFLDYRLATAQRDAANLVSQRHGTEAGRIWYLGAWGWMFYAEQNGFQHAVPGKTRLEVGDLLAVHNSFMQYVPSLDETTLVPLAPIETPTRHTFNMTSINYYAGQMPFTKLRRQMGVNLYRAKAPTLLPELPPKKERS